MFKRWKCDKKIMTKMPNFFVNKDHNKKKQSIIDEGPLIFQRPFPPEIFPFTCGVNLSPSSRRRYGGMGMDILYDFRFLEKHSFPPDHGFCCLFVESDWSVWVIQFCGEPEHGLCISVFLCIILLKILMKTAKDLRLGMGDVQILPGSRHRPPMKKPISSACYIFSSGSCRSISDWLPPAPAREFTDEEIASRAVIRDILKAPAILSKNPKIAFMFLSPGSLPFEKLWDKFFQGHEGKFSVYVHASKTKPIHVSRYFVNREIRSDQVVWGKISMVNAERRLLANALQDPDNQQFDPGPHGNGRYSERMLPEVELKNFRKGAQWFSMKRQHAVIVMADNLYYSKFKAYCQYWNSKTEHLIVASNTVVVEYIYIYSKNKS
ncbi:unnamed protein product [Sphenostylis stenocarpa]|uniref:Glycosyl transferase, family 14 n=1 Tax=Sphenostylis stenocarpa TaxID=92480 RepID=A0AA86SZQ1_9FABA|nr:unnamed protein product [Sphenostylis stenocarpa]